MAGARISAREKEWLVKLALRDRARRKARYQAERKRLAEEGRCRIEIFVPKTHVDTIRALAQEIDVQLCAGVVPELLFVPHAGRHAVDASEVVVDGGSDDQPTSLASEARGLGARARKRAQNQRARARKKAAGQQRVTIVVSARFDLEIRHLLRKAIAHLGAGDQVKMSDKIPKPSTPNMTQVPRYDAPVDQTERATAATRAGSTSPAENTPFDFQMAASDSADDIEEAPLFNDIKAIDRISW